MRDEKKDLDGICANQTDMEPLRASEQEGTEKKKTVDYSWSLYRKKSDRITMSQPLGWEAKVKEAAKAEGKSLALYIREAVEAKMNGKRNDTSKDKGEIAISNGDGSVVKKKITITQGLVELINNSIKAGVPICVTLDLNTMKIGLQKDEYGEIIVYGWRYGENRHPVTRYSLIEAAEDALVKKGIKFE